MSQPAWRLDPASRTAERLSDCPLSLNGIAKGYIVGGPATPRSSRAGGSAGVLLNVGGDLRVRGDVARTIGDRVAVGRLGIDRAIDLHRGQEPLGRHQRKLPARVADRRPVVFPCFRSTIGAAGRAGRRARRSSPSGAVDADALAKVCNVLEPEESLRLASSLPGVECLIVDERRTVAQSDGWQRLRTAAAGGARLRRRAEVRTQAGSGGAEAKVDGEAKPDERRRRRPVEQGSRAGRQFRDQSSRGRARAGIAGRTWPSGSRTRTATRSGPCRSGSRWGDRVRFNGSPT